jgi:trk system potassium uptake protein TrkH
MTAPQMFAGSFLLLIVGGTLGLKTLPGLYVNEELGWVDALFTSTSAVCVTGLIVVDTATYFTPAGHAFLLLLIQLGGLGVITFTSVILVAFGLRISVRQEDVSRSTAAGPEIDPLRLARSILLFTFGIEAAGATLLYVIWIPTFGYTQAVWPALFHAVSAFCNAGFSVFSDSLVRFHRNAPALIVVMLLIVTGGIGFLTLEELYQLRAARRMRKLFRLSIHSRLVLGTTALLLLGGWILFCIFEWRGVLAEMPLGHKLMNGLFMSVTARTAGFNTVDYAGTAPSTSFLSILLMSIGGSPGSTAGGLKTTTFALLGLVTFCRLRGEPVIHFSGRSMPEETVQRAITLFVAGFGLVAIAIFLFTITESRTVLSGTGPHFLRVMFEAVSAFNTVGLSMGATPELSPAGRLLTTLLMYLGRVGPLTFAAALARRKVVHRYRYAYEEVAIG